MQVKLQIHEKYREMEVHVCYHRRNEQVEEVAAQISSLLQESIQVTDSAGVQILPVAEIIRCYTEKQKVLVQSTRGTGQVPLKLYELEQLLPEQQFVRISRSEIVNIRRIRRLDMNMAGTIRVSLTDGTQTYTSRRCIPRLKEALGIGGKEELR